MHRLHLVINIPPRLILNRFLNVDERHAATSPVSWRILGSDWTSQLSLGFKAGQLDVLDALCELRGQR